MRTKFLLAGDASVSCLPAPRHQFALVSAMASSLSAATTVFSSPRDTSEPCLHEYASQGPPAFCLG